MKHEPLYTLEALVELKGTEKNDGCDKSTGFTGNSWVPNPVPMILKNPSSV